VVGQGLPEAANEGIVLRAVGDEQRGHTNDRPLLTKS
jgi:hypothetical protein